MKNFFTLVFLFCVSLNSIGQNVDADKYVRLIQNPSSDSVVSFGRTLFETGRISSALFLLEKSSSSESSELKENINHFLAGEPYTLSSAYSTYVEQYQKNIDQVRSTKNKKIKKAILDSLTNLQPANIFEKLAHMNACVEISMMLFNKKSAEHAIEKTKTSLEGTVELTVRAFIFNQLISASTRAKNQKMVNAFKIDLENIQKEIKQVDSSFQKEIILSATTKKEAPKVEAPAAEIPKSNSNLIVTIILGAIILILIVVLFLNHSSKKKKLSSFESTINELKDRLVHDTDIQNQSIRHHETQLNDARQIIALLESKNSDITKQYSEEASLTAAQITDYQNDLKTAIDKVTRENNVQNMMELNNTFTRSTQKLRENIKSLRN
jgi:flagellar biosynthesis regulator FlbT